MLSVGVVRNFVPLNHNQPSHVSRGDGRPKKRSSQAPDPIQVRPRPVSPAITRRITTQVLTGCIKRVYRISPRPVTRSRKVGRSLHWTAYNGCIFYFLHRAMG